MLYGVVWGARTSLRLAFIVVTLTVIVGVAVGSLAGFLGGKWDEFLMRIVDVFLAVPELILALAIAAMLGPSFRNIIIAISILGWPKYARIIRGQILHIKQNEYVDAATVMGDSRWRIYRKDMLPNAITPGDRASDARDGPRGAVRSHVELHRPCRGRPRRMGQPRERGSRGDRRRPLVGRDVRWR